MYKPASAGEYSYRREQRVPDVMISIQSPGVQLKGRHFIPPPTPLAFHM